MSARVAFFSTYVGIGGGESSLLGLFRALDRARVDPVLVCPREGRLPEAARGLGLDVRTLPWRGASVWFHPRAWALAPAVRRMARHLANAGVHAVHTDFHALPYVKPACRRLGLPVIFTVYGWWFRPKPWQRAFYLEPGLTMLAISEAVRRGFLEGVRWRETPAVEVLHLGTDPDTHRPRPDARDAVRASFALPADSPLVTLVARFQRVKGHDVFLDMARLVLRRHPGARFAVAGENAFGVGADERYRREVTARVNADPALRDAVHWLGWVEDPQHLVAASDVVVCASRFESFGMVHLEAMAAGTPIVSTEVGGPSETVVDGETGYLVPPGRPDLLARRVCDLLDDPDRRRTMGDAGRRRVQARFTTARYASRFAEVVEQAIGAPP